MIFSAINYFFLGQPIGRLASMALAF